MIDWITIIIALVIIATLVAFFGFLAWKINMSDPLTRDDNNQQLDSLNDKKKKEKNTSEQAKKKRKDQKKPKRETKDDEQQRQKVKETSEETDDEREESEQELLRVQSATSETSSKARKRNKNKTSSSTQNENNVNNPITTRAPPVTHPKSTPKDELQPNKQQQAKVQVKSSQVSNKQALPVSSSTTKKTTQSIQDQQQEQPFTVVGGNRHKTATPPLQQQQQQNKPQVNTTSSVAPISVAPVQQSSSAQVQRQQLPQKETPTQANNLGTNSLPVKQQPQTSKVQPKIADLIKVLPSSQAVVTELMSALDAFPLSTDELDIIMQKIANKQSVVRQDWSKLQHGQKVDPQLHIGQVMDESVKAYEDDMKNNSMKRVKELTNELNTEKRRNNDLLKEKSDKEREFQILHAQLDSVQRKPESTQVHPQQQKLQTLELQLRRLTEDNIHLNQQLSQQQQQLTTSSLVNNGDSSNLKVQILNDQMKKLSVDNANLEKKANSNELLVKEAQKEKEDLIRYNEQLTRSLQNAEKELKSIEEKHHKQLNESQTSDTNEFKRRIEQLEYENEQLRREDIVHVEPTSPTHIQTITLNNEEREELEKEINQLKQIIEEYKKKIDNLQNQRQSQESELRQEIDRLKQDKNNAQQRGDESRTDELAALRAELDRVKSTISQSEEHLRQEREKQRNILTDLLSQDVRNQLPQDSRDFDQWLSSYRQLFESSKRSSQEESAVLKRENEQLHKNMSDIENHLREIEKTVQSKEEALFAELKNKDTTLENVRSENDQLNGELKRLRNEIQQLQSVHDASDESFELVKQSSPSLSPIVIDIRAEQLNELIRSSKEALENQDSITQQLDKHLNDMHPSGQGEISTSNVDESTVSSSSDQQS